MSTTHHAYIHEGSLGELQALAEDARGRFGFSAEHNPDVHVREFEKFGIDESRWLSGVAGIKSASGRALFVVGMSAITVEAQQALLKLLEEPQQGTVLVLLAPHGAFLPTIRSRALPYPIYQGESLLKNSARTLLARKFLKMGGKERSDEIVKILKDEEGIKERVRDFVNALEAELAPKASDQKVRQGLEDIAMARSYLGDRSPSLKMLLEHLALSLPTF